MFVRAKRSGAYEYLQLVHNQRVDGRVRQQVIATLGRLDVLQDTGKIDALIGSCARFAQRTSVLEAHHRGKTEVAETVKIGPALVFERLWQELEWHCRGSWGFCRGSRSLSGRVEGSFIRPTSPINAVAGRKTAAVPFGVPPVYQDGGEAF